MLISAWIQRRSLAASKLTISPPDPTNVNQPYLTVGKLEQLCLVDADISDSRKSQGCRFESAHVNDTYGRIWIYTSLQIQNVG